MDTKYFLRCDKTEHPQKSSALEKAAHEAERWKKTTGEVKVEAVE